MSRQDPQMNVRIPPDLLGVLRDAARVEGRTLSSEVIRRLTDSVLPDAERTPAARKMFGVRLDVETIEMAKRLSRVRGQSLALMVEDAIVDAVEGMDDVERQAFEALKAHDEKVADDLSNTMAKLNVIGAAMRKAYDE